MMNGHALRALRWAWCGFVLGCGSDTAESSSSPSASASSGEPRASAAPATAANSGASARTAAAGMTAADSPAATEPTRSAAGGGAAGARPMTSSSAVTDSGSQGPREYTVSMCPGETPRDLPAERISCDGMIRCGGASRCVEGMSDQAGRAPECRAGRCVPDVVAIAGRVGFAPCEGSSGAGVCIPQCFALERNPLSAVFQLGEAGCGTQEVCIPCLNPVDQTDTGACDNLCGSSPAL